MAGGVTRNLRSAAAAAALAAGLAACQATDTPKPQVQAALAQPGMDSDIRRILTAGGLDANAPGQLQIKRMPPDVQQAVAALQGNPAPAAAAAATVPPAAQPLQAQPALQAAAQPEPSAAGSTGMLPPLPPGPPAMAEGLGSPRGRKGRGQPQLAMAAEPQPSRDPQPVGVSSFLPTPMPHMQTVVITGPGAARRGEAHQRAVAPAPRAPAPRVASATPPAAAPAPAPKPAAPPAEETVRVRRF